MMLVASGLPIFASPLLEERGKCNRDNLLRCYDPTGTNSKDIASRAAATAFCSSYLSIPVVTSVIATSTPVSTVTSVVTTTDGTEVVTSVSTSVFVEQSTVTTTVSASSAVSPVAGKRAVSTAAAPACAATTYVPSQVSSACSCLSLQPSTTYVTTTAPTSTSVSLSTVHDTTTTTTETTTTTTATSTSTVVETATPTWSACGQQYTAPNGQVFETACNHGVVHLSSDATIVSGTVPNLYSCLQLCITTYAPSCTAVDWQHQGICYILTRGTQVIAVSTYDTAYLSGSVSVFN